MNITQTVSLFKALLEGPLSRKDLARKTNTCPKSAGRMLTEMKAQGMIYVIGYTHESDGRNRVKVYALGEGEDALPERVTTQEERSRKSYVKKKQKAYTPKTKFIGGVSLWQ
jgi:DNA-binding MarR family transcriptional regulator